MMRTKNTMVIFNHPFTLPEVDGIQPAGEYAVEIDEEPIQDLSFIAYRKVGTRITLKPNPYTPWIIDTVSIDPRYLEQAQIQDATLSA